jgi:hypothetical protein
VSVAKKQQLMVEALIVLRKQVLNDIDVNYHTSEVDEAEFHSESQTSSSTATSTDLVENEQVSTVITSTTILESADILRLHMETPTQLTLAEQILLERCMENNIMKVNGKINWAAIQKEFKRVADNETVFERLKSRLESSAKWSKKRKRLSRTNVRDQQLLIEEVVDEATSEDLPVVDVQSVNMPQLTEVSAIVSQCSEIYVRKRRNGDLTHLERDFVRGYGIEMIRAGKIININELFKAYELKFTQYTRDRESLKKCWDNFKSTKTYKDMKRNFV